MIVFGANGKNSWANNTGEKDSPGFKRFYQKTANLAPAPIERGREFFTA
jgi:hypothetical protein